MRRRWLARWALIGPVLVVVGVDLARRAGRLSLLSGWPRLFYPLAVLESALVWGLLLHAASRRRGGARPICATLFVLGFTLTLGGQHYFQEQYHVYLNVDVSLFATAFVRSVANQLFADLGNYLLSLAPYLTLSLGLLWLARRVVRPSRSRARLTRFAAPLSLCAALFIPAHHRQEQAATPDVLYLHAFGGVIRSALGLTEQANQLRPRERASLPVPALASRAPARRNVLLFILESVRADAVCSAYDPGCKLTEATNRLLPSRHPLGQLRALASSTAISLAVLWTGLGPTEDRDTLHTWPLIFDYARAAGWSTAYWTSQNSLFGNTRLWIQNLGVDRMCTATDLDPEASIDVGAKEELLAARVDAEIGELREPFLAVVHLNNVHYPYRVVDTEPVPFQPTSTSKGTGSAIEFRNHYQNAVWQEDRRIASMIEHLRASPAGARTVVMYTSDHAEAFREHNQIGHTFSVFDEEIKVPGFIDAPPGTLGDAERAALSSKAEAFTFHVDFTPTILDLIGVWDDPGIARYRSRMLGTSLLRTPVTDRPLPMTNCAGVWSCAFENWGYMRGPMKLEARAWDGAYRCWNVLTDPREEHELPAADCGELEALAHATFDHQPGKGDKE